MPRQTLSLLLVLVLWITTPVAAQNLLSQLPIDGTSVRFLMKFKTKGEDKEMTATGTLNISSVGKETVDQQPCRWIEIYYAVTVNDREIKMTEKLLIPEEFCQAGQAPLTHIVKAKAYIQRGNRDPEPLTDALDALVSPIPIVLYGALENQQPLAKKLVESKLGQLFCEGLQGNFKYQKEGRQVTCQVTTWRHQKAPFGIVQAELNDIKIGQQPAFSISLTLNAILKNTRSRLPDLK
jgi:hypothetical protein